LRWIIRPALQSGLVTAGLVLCFYLRFSLESEPRPEFRRLEKEAGVRAAPPAVSGRSIGRRCPVLSLHRRGHRR
jgi:hypothetical protein